jgi:hypothetical protein
MSNDDRESLCEDARRDEDDSTRCPDNELGHHYERRSMGSDSYDRANASCVYCGKRTTLYG